MMGEQNDVKAQTVRAKSETHIDSPNLLSKTRFERFAEQSDSGFSSAFPIQP
jgi:hypothetical protein